MAYLSGHGHQVVAITFTVVAHERPGRFTVPKRIAEELGSGDDLPIRLTVETSGVAVFDGVIGLASGTEAYPIPGVGAKAPLIVTARRADL